MTDTSPFIETYLREIGVTTPVSLFVGEPANDVTQAYLEPETVANEAVEQVAEPVVATPIEARPVVSTGSLSDLAIRAADCTLCELANTRTNVVFGVGNPNADLVFVGEAPGRDEDLKGEPFVGRAGQLLDRMLAAMGLGRDEIYIMNTIKCRPPNNRDPKADEVGACNIWFQQQMDLLQPKMICLLGRVAAQTVLQSDKPLGAMREQWYSYQGIPTFVTYHPAFLLRSPKQKHNSWQDLQQVLARYRALSETAGVLST